MIYGSVCSGIEAASVAWRPLGWRAAFLSEIDPFARAVLEAHHQEVPLHGDFTTIEAGQFRAIDLLVGGTPCQSFSIAGLRGGLGDDRGNLALEYFRLADRLRPRWVVWENVFGVLSSHGGRDFGSILGALVELGYGFAYRVLDAQYVRTRRFIGAVPQRRRRVFVVGYFGDWRPAAAVLFDRESLSRNPAPRREAGQIASPNFAARTRGGGGLGTDFDLGGGLVANSGDVAYCLTASAQGSLDAETETLVAFDCKGTEVQTATNGSAPTLRAMAHSRSHGNGGGQLAVAFDMRGREGGAMPEGPHETAAIRAASGGSSRSYVAQPVAHALRGEGFDASEDGTGRGTPIIAIQERAGAESLTSGPGGAGFNGDGAAYTVEARTSSQSVATPWAVRRLTPRECERLQGFPDDYTNIPWRGKSSSPDGRRYKALGNSMAVNVMDWLGQRIQMVEDIVT